MVDILVNNFMDIIVAVMGVLFSVKYALDSVGNRNENISQMYEELLKNLNHAEKQIASLQQEVTELRQKNDLYAELSKESILLKSQLEALQRAYIELYQKYEVPKYLEDKENPH